MTAVEWLINKYFGSEENCSLNFRYKIKEAKEMEKQQIIDAYDDGNYAYGMGIKEPEQYYNETFNKI